MGDGCPFFTSIFPLFPQKRLILIHTTGLLIGCEKKKSNFRGFSDTNSLKFSVLTSPIGKKWLISWEFSVEILLEINRFCADLLSMLNVF